MATLSDNLFFPIQEFNFIHSNEQLDDISIEEENEISVKFSNILDAYSYFPAIELYSFIAEIPHSIVLLNDTILNSLLQSISIEINLQGLYLIIFYSANLSDTNIDLICASNFYMEIGNILTMTDDSNIIFWIYAILDISLYRFQSRISINLCQILEIIYDTITPDVGELWIAFFSTIIDHLLFSIDTRQNINFDGIFYNALICMEKFITFEIDIKCIQIFYSKLAFACNKLNDQIIECYSIIFSRIFETDIHDEQLNDRILSFIFEFTKYTPQLPFQEFPMELFLSKYIEVEGEQWKLFTRIITNFLNPDKYSQLEMQITIIQNITHWLSDPNIQPLIMEKNSLCRKRIIPIYHSLISDFRDYINIDVIQSLFSADILQSIIEIIHLEDLETNFYICNILILLENSPYHADFAEVITNIMQDELFDELERQLNDLEDDDNDEESEDYDDAKEDIFPKILIFMKDDKPSLSLVKKSIQDFLNLHDLSKSN